MNSCLLKKADGQIYIIVSINDITSLRLEKKELEKNKFHLEERVDLAIHSTDLGTWEMDTNTGSVILDRRSRELLCTEKETVTYEKFLTMVHPDDRKETDRMIREQIANAKDEINNIEYRTCYRNNEEMSWLKGSGRVYFNESGKAHRFSGTLQDITVQKLNEQLLKESEERFRIAADAAAVMIWLSTPDKFRNYFNTSWLKFTGRFFEQEEGNGWKESIHGDDFERCMKIYENCFNGRKEYSLEYRLRNHTGEYRWVFDVGAPRFSPQGIFEGYIGTCIDIHEQKMTREELQQLVEEKTRMLQNAVKNLEASNQNLEEFAYVASHDLQEPLRKIQSFSTRLQLKNEESLSEETKLYLSRIVSAANRMSRLIGDLLNYSRLKNTDEAMELTDLNEVVTNVLTDFDLTIQQKKAAIMLSTLPCIIAIPSRMGQLFHNLLSNALKFYKEDTPPIIHINAHTLSDKEKSTYPALEKGRAYTMITVSDNGIGFPQEYNEKIFNIFQRLNGISDYEGTGIGLAICRKIVLNHHGLIFAKSAENEGTTFYTILPLP